MVASLQSWFKTFKCKCAAYLNNRRLKKDTQAIFKRSQKIASQFYVLDTDEDFKEITDVILKSANTTDFIKKTIAMTGRRFFLFKYPSDGLQVKGYISFVPDPAQNPLLLFLRGGNRNFGLINPGSTYTCIRNYTVISTTYRGGISEGEDEFGLSDVNDVDNLLLHLPKLAEKLNIAFQPSKTFMLGASRGGMEMFLALSRSLNLQKQVLKAASLSGLLDLRALIASRKDMKVMFIKDYGLIPSLNEETWIKQRDPMEVVQALKQDLPFLIVQGSDDVRLDLHVGLNMVNRLREHGCSVTYLEIKGGDHCLRNQSNAMELIADWFEE